MRVPVSWLKEFIDIKASPEEIAEILTMGGVEVSGVEDPYEELGEIVTVKILEIKESQELKNLCICEVTDGKNRFSVLSTAKHLLSPGKVVGLAKPGSTLFTGEKVEEKVVKGFKSTGVFVSPFEAGVGESKAEILEFPEDTPIGKSVYQVLNISEPVLELEITPNRGDVLSIFGTARELHALTGWELKEPRFEDYIKAGSEFNGKIEIQDKDGCYRYLGRTFKGIKVKESPFHIQKRLWLCGLSPINNVVDITNYVMLELGQPLHAFDWETIKGKKVIARKAKAGEGLKLLDGRYIELREDDLVIADAERPMVLAGIMGGEDTGVKEDTQTVFLEAAWFNPKRIRMSSKYHNVSTDSSYRFERGIDPEGILRAVLRASELLVEIAGAEGFSLVEDINAKPYVAPLISLSQKKLVKYLGFSLPSQEVEKLLARVGNVRRIGEEFEVIPFSYRNDLRIEEDLIEEVARIYGYEKIPTTYPRGVLYSKGACEEVRFEGFIRRVLSSLGLYEVITYSFISPDFVSKLRLEEGDPRAKLVELDNPISQTQSVMRTTLIPGLLEVAKFNFFREVDSLKIFEVGKVFFEDESSDTKVKEELKVGTLLMGYKFKDEWFENPVKFDVFDMKGILEELGTLIGSYFEFAPYSEEVFLKRGLSFDLLLEGKKVGFAGALKDWVLKKFDLKGPVFVAELDADLLKNAWLSKKPEVKKPFRFPSTFRDVTCIVDRDVKIGEILKFVEEQKVRFLERVKCIKIYEGPPIPEGKKSISLRFWYRAEDRTLTDEEVNQIQEELAKKIFEEFKAIPR